MSRKIHAWAATSAGSKLELTEFEAPSLGPNGVEIKVTHCGICGSDVHLLHADGGYADYAAFPKPQVCGHEVIGTVTEVGNAVLHLKVGDRAGIGWQSASCHNCEWCFKGDEQLCGLVKCTCCEGNIGGFADYIRIEDGRFAFKIPEACDSAATAPLLCGGVTVWTPLRNHTRAGDRVGVIGVGGLGHMAIKFAVALGCEVTAISSTESKKGEALSMGAHKFLAHGDPAQMEAAAKSLDFMIVTFATKVGWGRRKREGGGAGGGKRGRRQPSRLTSTLATHLGGSRKRERVAGRGGCSQVPRLVTSSL